MFKLLIYGLLGFGVYTWTKQRQAVDPAIPTQGPARNKLTSGAQPSQRYPFRVPLASRVDNANQPWYAGAKSAVQGAVGGNMSTGQLLQQGATVVHSLSDVWGQMSDWFGHDTSSDDLNLTSSDSVDGIEGGYDMAGSGEESSNIVGSQMDWELGLDDSSSSWDSGLIA